MLLVLVTMAVCYLFWQFNAPMPRYGYAYILLLVALLAGYVIEEMRQGCMCRGRDMPWKGCNQRKRIIGKRMKVRGRRDRF